MTGGTCNKLNIFRNIVKKDNFSVSKIKMTKNRKVQFVSF